MKNLRRLFPYIVRYRTRIGLGLLFIVASNGLALLLPKFSSQAIDSLRLEDPEHSLGWYAGAIVIAYLLSAVFRYFIRHTIVIMSRLVEFDLRQDLWKHVQSLSQRFFRLQQTGDIMARLSNDVEAVRMFPGPAMMYSMDSGIRLVFVIGFMLTLSPALTGVVLLPMPLLGFFVYMMSSRIHSRHTLVQEKFSAMTSRTQQNFAGIRVVKSYTRENREIELFENAAEDYRQDQMGLARIQAFFRPMMMFIPRIAEIIILGFGGWLATTDAAWVRNNNSGLTIGELTAFIMCLNILVWPMMALGWVTSVAQRADASMKRLNAFMDIEPEIADDDETDQNIEQIEGDIEFDDISVVFDGEPVLQEIKLTVPKGSTYAIIGRTGSGKSTLVNLIPRLLDPSSGQVRIGNVPLQRIPLKVLRSQISVAAQEPLLFSETIRNNIRFSNLDAPEEEVTRAVEIAQLDKDIADFPNGLESRVGERGLTLSGGQKQRCVLARAIMANPKMLILDDTFSAVDTGTEEAILQRLRKFMKERTTLLISHRTSTVQQADRIVVLEHGRIAEQGTHAELIESGGIYADIHQKQLLESELEHLD